MVPLTPLGSDSRLRAIVPVNARSRATTIGVSTVAQSGSATLVPDGAWRSKLLATRRRKGRDR